MPKSSIQRTLLGLSIALYLEAGVLYIATGATIWSLIIGDTNSLITSLFLGAVCLGAALWLTIAAKAIREGKRWARSAAIFWQLIQLAIAFGTYDVSVFGFLGIALPSTAVLITLFNKQVVAATGQARD